MYNKKSRVSAILSLITAALFIGLLIIVSSSFSKLNFGEENIGAAFFFFLFGAYGTVIFYVGAVLVVLVTAICGAVLLRGKTQKRLISANTGLFVMGLILSPIAAVGLAYIGMLYSMAVNGTLCLVFIYIAGAAYLGSVVVAIVTRILLKRMPEGGYASEPASVAETGEDGNA